MPRLSYTTLRDTIRYHIHRGFTLTLIHLRLTLRHSVNGVERVDEQERLALFVYRPTTNNHAHADSPPPHGALCPHSNASNSLCFLRYITPVSSSDDESEEDEHSDSESECSSSDSESDEHEQKFPPRRPS